MAKPREMRKLVRTVSLPDQEFPPDEKRGLAR